MKTRFFRAGRGEENPREKVEINIWSSCQQGSRNGLLMLLLGTLPGGVGSVDSGVSEVPPTRLQYLKI